MNDPFKAPTSEESVLHMTAVMYDDVSWEILYTYYYYFRALNERSPIFWLFLATRTNVFHGALHIIV